MSGYPFLDDFHGLLQHNIIFGKVIHEKGDELVG